MQHTRLERNNQGRWCGGCSRAYTASSRVEGFLALEKVGRLCRGEARVMLRDADVRYDDPDITISHLLPTCLLCEEVAFV